MDLVQLRGAVRQQQISRVEIVRLRYSGFAVRILNINGGWQALPMNAAHNTWPQMDPLKAALRSCGIVEAVLVQPEAHDEVIGRPALRQADTAQRICF